jgi:hypothetical protein
MHSNRCDARVLVFNTAGGALHYQIELVSYQDRQGEQSIMVNTIAQYLVP